MSFIEFSVTPQRISETGTHTIYHFSEEGPNRNEETIEAFGDEWKRFNSFSDNDIDSIARNHYFDIVPIAYMQDKKILDMGCGTGRWTKFVAKFASTVDAVDPSIAIESAARLLSQNSNVRLSKAGVDALPFADNVFDMIFSLGVLHHIPDTQLAMKQCMTKLKTGGYFLVYLYYDLDNRGKFFRGLFNLSTLFRNRIAKMRPSAKNFTCDLIAIAIYLPFVVTGKIISGIGLKNVAQKIPLHFYIDKGFHIIRNDARDRFGTPLEQRFTKHQIREMMENCGLTDIIFSEKDPYWHAIGKKK